MPKMLTGNGQKGWPYIQRLLVDLFQFMEPFLRHAELGDPVCFFISSSVICFKYGLTLMVLLTYAHPPPLLWL